MLRTLILMIIFADIVTLFSTWLNNIIENKSINNETINTALYLSIEDY